MVRFKYIPPTKLGDGSASGNYRFEVPRSQSMALLLGLAKIQDSQTSRIHKLPVDYGIVPYQTSSIRNIDQLLSRHYGSISKQDIEDFFHNKNSHSTSFHQKVRNEIMCALGYDLVKQPIPAFVSIYRIIEQIALCAPFVLIFDGNGYYSSFDQLKEIILNDAKSDLSVLRNFSDSVLDRTIGSANVTFDFTGLTHCSKYVARVFETIPDKLGASKTANTVTVKFSGIHYVIVGIRNGFFHYMHHEKNLDYDKLPLPEEFFSRTFPLFMNYVSQLVIALISAEVRLMA